MLRRLQRICSTSNISCRYVLVLERAMLAVEMSRTLSMMYCMAKLACRELVLLRKQVAQRELVQLHASAAVHDQEAHTKRRHLEMLMAEQEEQEVNRC